MYYRNFLTSASLISRGLYFCASRGADLGTGKISAEQVRLGELIEGCARDTLTGFNTRNTILGSILLYVPLTVAISSMLQQKKCFSAEILTQELSRIIESTSVQDAVWLYRTFELTKPGGKKIKDEPEWTASHSRYDFDNPDVIDNIMQDKISLGSLLKMSAQIDEISSEWASDFRLTLTEILPYLTERSSGIDDIEEAIVSSYIWLLSKRPDGLIIKKAGRKKAEEIQEMARQVVNLWEENEATSALVRQLDEKLRKQGNLLNPGTTADLVSAATFCRLVSMNYPEF